MCAFPELGVEVASDALTRHGLETLGAWVTTAFARRDLRLYLGEHQESRTRLRRFRALSSDPEVARRGPDRFADMSFAGSFAVGSCGCGWRRVLEVRDVVLELFDTAEVKRVRFGLPWFDSLDAPRLVTLDELRGAKFEDLDQALVETRRSAEDPRPTQRLRDIALRT